MRLPAAGRWRRPACIPPLLLPSAPLPAAAHICGRGLRFDRRRHETSPPVRHRSLNQTFSPPQSPRHRPAAPPPRRPRSPRAEGAVNGACGAVQDGPREQVPSAADRATNRPPPAAGRAAQSVAAQPVAAHSVAGPPERRTRRSEPPPATRPAKYVGRTSACVLLSSTPESSVQRSDHTCRKATLVMPTAAPGLSGSRRGWLTVDAVLPPSFSTACSRFSPVPGAPWGPASQRVKLFRAGRAGVRDVTF